MKTIKNCFLINLMFILITYCEKYIIIPNYYIILLLYSDTNSIIIKYLNVIMITIRIS